MAWPGVSFAEQSSGKKKKTLSSKSLFMQEREGAARVKEACGEVSVFLEGLAQDLKRL
jgi:hypothetical protein